MHLRALSTSSSSCCDAFIWPQTRRIRPDSVHRQTYFSGLGVDEVPIIPIPLDCESSAQPSVARPLLNKTDTRTRPGSNNTIMMAAIVLERSNAYSNGADGSVNGTAENISKDLGNGGYTFSLSATKIAIIIAVIAASMIGAGIFWYYRKLDIRRRVDLRNRERAAAMVNGLPDPALGRPGDPIELVDIFANRPRTPPRPGSQGEQKDLQHPPKAALFDYVGWKDPHKTELILPKPQACNSTYGAFTHDL